MIKKTYIKVTDLYKLLLANVIIVILICIIFCSVAPTWLNIFWLNDIQMTRPPQKNISHRLGPIQGWRAKRLNIAIALRQQGWSYHAIGEHLYISPKSIMRDIKCFVIKSKKCRHYHEIQRINCIL